MSDQATWFYAVGTVQQGPVTAEQVLQMLQNNQIGGDTLVWRDGMADWVPASSLPEFQLAAPPPQQVSQQPQWPPPPPVDPPQWNPGAPVPPPAAPNYSAGYGASLPYSSLPPEAQQLQSQATTSMVVGIISLVVSGCVCGPVGLGLGIWAWTLGNKIPPGYPFSGQGNAGKICGIIATILGGLSTILQFLWIVGAFAGGRF